MKRLVRLISVVILGLPVTAPLAQQISSKESVVSQVSNPPKPAYALQRVTLDLHDVTMESAIRAISEQAGLMPVYPTDVLPKKLVTLKVRSVTAADALNRVLQNTGLAAEISGSGVLGLVRKAQGASVAQGVVAGKVTDGKTDKGISGATVSVGQEASGVTAGEDGTYRIGGLAAGTHTVSVRALGYTKQSRAVVIGEGATVTANFSLSPSASVLNEVIVTGTVASTELKAVPSAITVITAKELEQRGITRIDQLFRGEIPGLFSMDLGAGTGSGGGGGIGSIDEVIMFSRGASKITTSTFDAAGYTNPIKTYVDGVEMADSRYLSQIDPKSIERIEILTGPQASTVYGANAINGVMQIFTKRGKTTRPTLTLSMTEGWVQSNFSSALTPAHQYDGSIAGLEGKVSYNIGSGWNYDGAWTPGKQMQRTSIFGGGKYQLSNFSIDLSTRRGWSVNKQSATTTQGSDYLVQTGVFQQSLFPPGLFPITRSLLSTNTSGVTIAYTPFAWWSHQLNVGRDFSYVERLTLTQGFRLPFDTSMTGNSQSPSSRTSSSYSSTFRFPVLSFAQAMLTYGGDSWRTSSSTIGWTKNGDGSLSSPSVTRNKPDKNSGVYVQTQLGFMDALFLTYGVRTDWNPNYGERASAFPSRYGISYSKDFNDVSVKLRGSYGRSIRPPLQDQRQSVEILPTGSSNIALLDLFGTPGEPFYNRLANPELGPEFQQGGEGGIELYIGNRASLVVTRYNQTVDGLINTVFSVDSVRARQPGFIVGFANSACDAESDVRSDGYCYRPQSMNMNVASIRNQGWEFQGSVNTGPFTTRGTYSWGKSRVVGVTPRYRALLTNVVFLPGQTFNHVPEHTWALNISYAQRGTSVLLNVNGVGETLRGITDTRINEVTTTNIRLRGNQSQRFDSFGSAVRYVNAGYVRANLNGAHTFTRSLDGTLQVTNVTNQYHNDISAAYVVPGRTTRLGLRWRY